MTSAETLVERRNQIWDVIDGINKLRAEPWIVSHTKDILGQAKSDLLYDAGRLSAEIDKLEELSAAS